MQRSQFYTQISLDDWTFLLDGLELYIERYPEEAPVVAPLLQRLDREYQLAKGVNRSW